MRYTNSQPHKSNAPGCQGAWYEAVALTSYSDYYILNTPVFDFWKTNLRTTTPTGCSSIAVTNQSSVITPLSLVITVCLGYATMPLWCNRVWIMFFNKARYKLCVEIKVLLRWILWISWSVTLHVLSNNLGISLQQFISFMLQKISSSALMPHTLNVSDISTKLHITVIFVYDLPAGTILHVRTHWLVSYIPFKLKTKENGCKRGTYGTKNIEYDGVQNTGTMCGTNIIITLTKLHFFSPRSMTILLYII